MVFRKKKKVKRKVKRKGKAFGGYKIKPDANLAKVIGNKAVSPSEMTKKLWTYIKRKRLAKK
jgi:chromatin remodeling complex protein RSC6